MNWGTSNAFLGQQIKQKVHQQPPENQVARCWKEKSPRWQGKSTYPHVPLFFFFGNLWRKSIARLPHFCKVRMLVLKILYGDETRVHFSTSRNCLKYFANTWFFWRVLSMDLNTFVSVQEADIQWKDNWWHLGFPGYSNKYVCILSKVWDWEVQGWNQITFWLNTAKGNPVTAQISCSWLNNAMGNPVTALISYSYPINIPR